LANNATTVDCVYEIKVVAEAGMSGNAEVMLVMSFWFKKLFVIIVRQCVILLIELRAQ